MGPDDIDGLGESPRVVALVQNLELQGINQNWKNLAKQPSISKLNNGLNEQLCVVYDVFPFNWTYSLPFR